MLILKLMQHRFTHATRQHTCKHKHKLKHKKMENFPFSYAYVAPVHTYNIIIVMLMFMLMSQCEPAVRSWFDTKNELTFS